MRIGQIVQILERDWEADKPTKRRAIVQYIITGDFKHTVLLHKIVKGRICPHIRWCPNKRELKRVVEEARG